MNLPDAKYRCIVADPPWLETTIGRFRGKHKRPDRLPYSTMTIDEIMAIPVQDIVAEGCHLWLWTTNRSIAYGFKVMRAWGFTYLNTITWIKPSGFGAWFVNTTQHCLFGYHKHCTMRERYLPTHFTANPGEHSAKPSEFYALVRRISDPPRIDLFNRREIADFDGWGNETPPPQLKLW